MKKEITKIANDLDISETAHYLIISFPFDEELCSYRDCWNEVLYMTKYPLVSKNVWTGIINLRTHKVLNWKEEYGNLFFQAKVCDNGTYILLDSERNYLCKLQGYVPNKLIPESDDCGDYIRLRINYEGTIENWPDNLSFTEFIEDALIVDKIDEHIKENSILNTSVSLTYSQLLNLLLKLPRHLQMEIGKALIENASDGVFDDLGEE